MNQTRRSFFRQSTAAAGAAWLGSPAVFAGTPEQSRKRFGGFDFGIQGHCLRNFPLEKAVEIIANDFNLNWVEFSVAHVPLQSRKGQPAITLEQIESLKKLLRAHNLSMSASGVNPFKKDAAQNRKTFELAKALGVRNITAAPTPDAFDSLEKLVAEFDIRIAIHNHGPSSGCPTTAALVQALKGRHPHIGVCVDTGHSLRSGDDPVRAIYDLKGRIFGVHLKDVAEMKEKTTSVVLGKGHLDVDAVFRALRKVSFPADGALSLEYEAEPDNPLPSIRACLEVASKAAQKSMKS
jgi:inosose dehydratase